MKGYYCAKSDILLSADDVLFRKHLFFLIFDKIQIRFLEAVTQETWLCSGFIKKTPTKPPKNKNVQYKNISSFS